MNFNAEGIAKLCEPLRSGQSALKSLYLENNKFGDQGASVIADVLNTNKTLTEIKLIGAKIGDAGANAMGDSLKRNSTLKKLSCVDTRVVPCNTNLNPIIQPCSE